MVRNSCVISIQLAKYGSVPEGNFYYAASGFSFR